MATALFLLVASRAAACRSALNALRSRFATSLLAATPARTRAAQRPTADEMDKLMKERRAKR